MSETVKGYLWAELDVIDPAKFEDEYSVHVRPLLASYGATFLIVDEHPRVLEGDRVVRKVVLVQFDSPATAQRFYDDPAYQAIVTARRRWSRGHVYLVDGA